jgi:hypothetical protein
MYSGFCRLLNTFNIKERYMYAAYSQEVMLHTVPLTMLVMYNNYSLEKETSQAIYGVDKAIIAFSCLHLVSIAVEFFYFRVMLNMDKNLE